MTKDELQTLRALVDAATPGPWKPSVWIETDGDEWRATGPGHDQHAHDYGSEPGGPDEQAAQRDAAFICAARSALPRLLDECEALRRERDRYAWATPAANVTRPAGCRCDLWPRGYCRDGCPSGDSARDKLAAECERLRALVNRAADSLDYCVQRHGEYSKSVRGDELRAAAKEGLT